IAILHTWDQKLLDHFHLHCLIPAGALSADGSTWIHTNRDYLFSVHALSVVFRGKFIDFFKQAYEQNRLHFVGKTEALTTDKAFQNLLKSLWQKDWVVYCKPPLDNPKLVLQYLSRYVHRVAITNHRIVNVSNGNVTFTYKDRQNNTVKECTIKAVEFIRRFLLHVLPKDFMRIRSYGFLANRSKKKDLTRCKELLGVKTTPSKKKSTRELIKEMIGIDITQCPQCSKGKMLNIREIQPLSETYTIDQVFTMFGQSDTS
ncbi:transposase, partial [candidate division CSSED10-310 bacterium]